jgi:hypothetical protein
MPKLSVLIPSIPSRFTSHFLPLYTRLEALAKGFDVELLALIDNKRRSIGLKRDALVQAAIGEYLAFVDDDDDVTEAYFPAIFAALAEQGPRGLDLITFDSRVFLNDDAPFLVRFGMECANEECHHGEGTGTWADITRRPFPCCVWRREIAQAERFPDCSYGEDADWALRAEKRVVRWLHLPEVLHVYRYRREVTEAEATFPPGQ